MVDKRSMKDQLMAIKPKVPSTGSGKKKGPKKSQGSNRRGTVKPKSTQSRSTIQRREKAKQKRAAEKKRKKVVIAAMNKKTQELKGKNKAKKAREKILQRPVSQKRQENRVAVRLPAPSNVDQSFSFQERNTSFFKNPDSWVSNGRDLHSDSGRTLAVTIGIDFGTAYTKVALSLLGKVFVVNWKGVNKQGGSYWIPGEVSVRESDGAVLLGHSQDSNKFFGNLKVPFLGKNKPNLTQQALATIFLAWVMRYARAWLFHEHKLSIQGRRIAWAVNLGTANSSWEDDSSNNLYRKVGLTAWKMSQEQSIFTIDGAKKELQEKTPDVSDVGLDLLEVVPEFLAQVAGYTRSEQRQDGLHLLVDVGAGTIDIAVFNVYHYNNRKEGVEEDRFVLIDCSIEQAGAYFFMQHRLSSVGKQDENWSDSAGVPDKEDFARIYSVSIKKINEIDQIFMSHVGNQVKKVLQSVASYYQTAPEFHYARCDNYRLKTFLTGGGSSCDVYSTAVDSAFGAVTAKKLMVKLPVPKNLAGKITETDFHRLSVAYGLTFDKEIIGRIYTREMIGENRIQAPTRIREDFGDCYSD